MGAHDFSQTEIAKTPREAYNRAVKEAEYEEGHNGYNATISTTDRYYFFDEHPRWGTKKFDDWENKILAQDHGPVQKWEACGCVEITGKAAKEIKDTHGFKGRRGLKVFYFFGWAAS